MEAEKLRVCFLNFVENRIKTVFLLSCLTMSIFLENTTNTFRPTILHYSVQNLDKLFSKLPIKISL